MTGITPEEIHKIEQGAQAIKDHFLPSLKTFFDGALEQDFTREEAFDLTKTYMKLILYPNARPE